MTGSGYRVRVGASCIGWSAYLSWLVFLRMPELDGVTLGTATSTGLSTFDEDFDFLAPLVASILASGFSWTDGISRVGVREVPARGEAGLEDWGGGSEPAGGGGEKTHPTAQQPQQPRGGASSSHSNRGL